MIQGIRKPLRDITSDFDTVCVHRRSATQSILRDIREKVFAAYGAYDTGAGSPVDVFPIDLDDDAANALRGNYLYTYGEKALAQLRADALASVNAELCPMCGAGYVSSLDHFLPKDRFPEFSILAFNLVPTCTRCNQNKRSAIGGSAGRFFHAYYDQVPETPSLLIVEVEIAHRSAIVSFKVNESLPQALYRNASYQFDKLQLEEAYVGAAVQELVEHAPLFASYYDMGGREAVAREAGRLARHMRKKFGAQFWKAALYDAIELSEEFCGGGFKYLASEGL